MSAPSALESSLLELLAAASTRLSDDAFDALVKAYRSEQYDSRSQEILWLILENLRIAHEDHVPMTPHTSSIHFYVETPESYDRIGFESAARAAVAQATRDGLLQQNLVDPITRKVLKTNVGVGMPQLHFDSTTTDRVEVRLLMKGNGAEGSGLQFVLPDESISAGNDVRGIRRAVLEGLVRIQGRGCGPGILGVGIGGDRASGMSLATRQLLRPVGDRASQRATAELEKQLLEDANSLSIGPLGLGGRNTVLAVKIAAQSSARESCYVSLSYVGWALRRQGVELDSDGAIKSWLYAMEHEPVTKRATPPKPKPKPEPKPAIKQPTLDFDPLDDLDHGTFLEMETAKSLAQSRQKAERKKTKRKSKSQAASKAVKTATAEAPAENPKAVKKKTPAKKAPAKKAPAKKAPAKKAPAKKTPAKKTPAKKTPAKKKTATRRKSASKKTNARKS